MNQVPKQTTEVFNDGIAKSIWLIQDYAHAKICYGVVTQVPYKPPHLCGYLNVDRGEWYRVRSVILRDQPITFQGIESDLFWIPKTLNSVVPVDINNFWIGIDYMNRMEGITIQSVATKLGEIYSAFNSAL